MGIVANLCQWYLLHGPRHRGKTRIVRACLRRLPQKHFTRRMAEGFLMSLPAGDPVGAQMLLTGTWEEQNTALVRPGDTFVDVGANFGYFTLLASSLVGSQARVIALEPMPSTYQVLRENVVLNQADNVTALPTAAGDQETPLTLSLFSGDSAATASQFMAWREKSVAQYVVPSTTLDIILSDVDRAVPTFIKIDVEGAECAVLSGGGETLKSLQPILMLEVLPALAEAAGWKPQELVAMLAEHGYTCRINDEGELRPLDEERDFPSVASHDHVELFAFKLSVPWHVARLSQLAPVTR